MQEGGATRGGSDALSRGQKFAFALLWLGVIGSRFPAMSKTLLDWDETLFAWGVDEYDVTIHHPHPPGYPLFVAAAKLVRPLVASDVRALQAVATFGSALLFPAAFLLARALKLRTPVALVAAVLTSFLPTVWYYGGTALSDVPAICLALFASALLLGPAVRAPDGETVHDPPARMPALHYPAGCLVAALAGGFRPQLLLIIAVPALIGAYRLRRPRLIALSWLAGASLVVLAYLAAAYVSADFPRGYLARIGAITKYIHDADSIANPERPPLRELAPKALWFPFAGGRARWWILGFAAIGLADALVRRRAAVLIVLVMFVPTALLTWVLLDPTCVSRYAVAYAPGYALLAAAGISAVAARLGRLGTPFVLLAGATIAVMLIQWTRPALKLVHDTASPPVAAFDWIRTHVPRSGGRVFIENEFIYQANYLLRDYDYKLVYEPRDVRPEDLRPGNVLVVEAMSHERGARVWRRPRKELWLLARPRYFETSIVPMHTMTWFLEGWYGVEGEPPQTWRWMGPNAGILFPPVVKSGALAMTFYVPTDATPRPPLVTLTWNGTVIDRVRATRPELVVRHVLPSRSGAHNELRISVDVWANPKRDGTGEDARDLALSLQSMSWQPAALQ